ncbi:MAG: alpha-amylase [Blastocatellia bacterium]|nr:alpha-amylase [Blastocatellia bacterium]
MKKHVCLLLLLAVVLCPLTVGAQNPARDVSQETARQRASWIDEAVVYEIFPRVFSTTGNFAGVEARLDQLKELGVTVLWLMPVHPVGELKRKGTLGSPYAVKDYYGVNPEYGTPRDLKKLIGAAHRQGFKVVIDIVANHTAWDSVMMKSPEFYSRDAKGEIRSPFPDWADVADLNYDNPKLREYMIGMLKFWLSEYDLDGFRCDVAGEVPTSFWEEARAALERVKPDILMLAESDRPDLLVKAFDLDYAWPFHHALDEVFSGREPATAIRKTWETERQRFPKNGKHMFFSDNHDERRALARFGERGALAAATLVFTMDGVPLIYNGMEAGDTAESGAPALFEKVPITWAFAERRPEFPRFFKSMIALRKAHPALRQGETVWLRNSDEAQVLSYVRRDANEEFLVVINCTNRPWRGFVEVDHGRPFTDVTPNLSGDPAKAQPVALPALALDAMGFRIFKRTSSKP